MLVELGGKPRPREDTSRTSAREEVKGGGGCKRVALILFIHLALRVAASVQLRNKHSLPADVQRAEKRTETLRSLRLSSLAVCVPSFLMDPRGFSPPAGSGCSFSRFSALIRGK